MRVRFTRLVITVFIIYVVYAIFTQAVFVQDCFRDFYVDSDEAKFIRLADGLAHRSYSSIWKQSFGAFKYSDTPLFYAIIGTIQKAIDMDIYYSLLFQKIVVAFLSSIISGIVYLMGCNVTGSRKIAFKSAMVYSFFTAIVFYSISFMRDVHIALIFCIGLYLITNEKYNISCYLYLVILGVLAYFIRVENGLFFLSFIGAWMMKSTGKYRPLFILIGIIFSIVGIYTLGGLSSIIQTASETADIYQNRAIELSTAGSLGVQLNKLPIPFNYIAKTIFGQLDPFPFWAYFNDKLSVLENLLYLPRVIAGLFWFVVWLRICMNLKVNKLFFSRYKWAILVSLLYLVLVSTGQTNPRRLMAVYPIIFMAYISIDKKLIRYKEIVFGIASYFLLILIYLALKIG
ncbi:hypothetical protein SAMN05192529_13413 [Arachidicoccus rhizosphaerae]|uniref:Dolichyl-phosphate-mannose-protein mannosyltransferase n=1 Tax=Arachidicoccus rhizosphaerae TaxID=551991 RepID=A0A1H4CNR6_9BACT|nr:hypothetical protein [Arachidicoccus rhizosphaerae]SEA62096.1 hypothetical protein SAMN05192529_13413 [Arachidicoccus rhizosphaerae]